MLLKPSVLTSFVQIKDNIEDLKSIGNKRIPQYAFKTFGLMALTISYLLLYIIGRFDTKSQILKIRRERREQPEGARLNI